MMSSDKRYAGPCAGGPHDGKMIEAETPNIIIPLAPPRSVLFNHYPTRPTNFSQGEYKWNDDVKMWIWQGKWKGDPYAR